MRKRSKAREIAAKLLYEAEVSSTPRPAEVERRVRELSHDESVIAFASAIFRGVRAHQEFLNRKIASVSEHWDLDRIGAVERNILRMALFEIFFLDDVPPKVSIDEAVELAKKYGTTDSAAFVNGILDRLWKEAQASHA